MFVNQGLNWKGQKGNSAWCNVMNHGAFPSCVHGQYRDLICSSEMLLMLLLFTRMPWFLKHGASVKLFSCWLQKCQAKYWETVLKFHEIRNSLLFRKKCSLLWPAVVNTCIVAWIHVIPVLTSDIRNVLKHFSF